MNSDSNRQNRLLHFSAFAAAFIALLTGATNARAFAILEERIIFDGPNVDVVATLEQASRWSSISGLADGIQVGVAVGFAASLGVARIGRNSVENTPN